MTAPPTWSGTVVVDRHRIAVDVHGEDPSPLLVNGLGCSRAVWAPLRGALPPSVGTVAYDAPGCGDSAPFRRPLPVTGHAALAAGVATALDLERVDVLGFSFGGMVAQQLAADRPTLVRRLVLASTSWGLGSWPGTVAGLVPAGWLATAPRPAPAPRHREVLSVMGQALAAVAWTSLPWVTWLGQPTLVLTGDHDHVVPMVNAVGLAGAIPRAELWVVGGGGHFVVLERAADVAPIVTRFLRGPHEDRRPPTPVRRTRG